MNSSIIRDTICWLIRKECHPTSYHCDVKRHVTLNIIFSGASGTACMHAAEVHVSGKVIKLASGHEILSDPSMRAYQYAAVSIQQKQNFHGPNIELTVQDEEERFKSSNSLSSLYCGYLNYNVTSY